MKKNLKTSLILGGALLFGSSSAFATCSEIFSAWKNDDFGVVGQQDNGGYGLPMWIAVVDETGTVCAVANSSGKSGTTVGNTSWLGSRVIAVQKATTANEFSLDAFAISTANLYGLTQPGGSLFGLQASNPVDGSIAYAGDPSKFGAVLNDPLVGKRVGGVNVFGGGLALYSGGKKIGAIGVSGDTSCTDHAVAWKLRAALGFDSVPAGFISDYAGKPTSPKGDEMVIRQDGNVANTFKQVSCAHNHITNPASGAATGVIIE